MGKIILIGLIILAILMMLKIVYDSNKKYKRFMKLKPNDKIRVWIYSQFCECTRFAEVTKASDGKFIEAKLLEDCKNCSEFNSKDKTGKETCWYDVSKFTKEDVEFD